MIKIQLQKKFKNEKMDFSFELTSNRTVVFGPSGCGKTTLLKMICGICKPDTGTIFLNSKCLYSSANLINTPIYMRNIGYLPQENSLFPNLTVKNNILYGVNVAGITLNEKRFKYIVDKLQIEAKLNEYPSSLSGGQNQRAALARTLMINPSLLLLDEPFTALDSPIRNCLRDIVVDFADNENLPLIFVSHNLEDCYSIAKELVVIDAGKIIEYGNAHKILETPTFYRTAQLFDYRNIWEIDRMTDGTLFLKNGMSVKASQLWDDSYKYLCVRPEKIRLLNDAREIEEKNQNAFSGKIVENHPKGAYKCLTFISNTGYKFEINASETYLRKANLGSESKAVIYIDKESLIFCK